MKNTIMMPAVALMISFTMAAAVFGDTNQEAADHDYLAELHKTHDKLALENSIADQILQKNLASLQAQLEEISRKLELITKSTALKEAEKKVKQDAQFEPVRSMIEQIRLSNELVEAENSGRISELARKKADIQFRETELELQKMELENKLTSLNFEIESRDKQDQLNNRVKHDIQYSLDPYRDGILTISDRRIALNDIITMESADYVIERINYFNNQNSTYPIFIVIDASPGGSVMAGYAILKAMNGSPAPVYVVVKSFAASMAANITTQAKKSFAYQNAIILHHQLLSVAEGNLTEQRETVKEEEEWWRRLASPVAAKMGLSLDDFIKEMYKHRSTGDWMEFADNAKKLKWVDQIVDTINEESFVKNPDSSAGAQARPRMFELSEQTGADGKRFKLLPRLAPVDCYYIYNPDNYYRLER
ncbi:MAG: ATP-dependent Clp protease proteolytic subunit [Brevinematales bacterium]